MNPSPQPPLIKPIPEEESRSVSQITEHYLLERRLADRLRKSTREERNHLYQEVYNELFSTLTHHPAHTIKHSSESLSKKIHWQVGLLRRFLRPDTVFLEVGAGDCALSLELCQHVRTVYAADVSSVISETSIRPANFNLIVYDGISLPIADGSVDVVFSNQVMEHLHPDDARTQLADIYRVLKPGGRYVCVTPNRIGGPWDISEYFDRECTGFHLKEYTYAEMQRVFRAVGFRGISAYVGGRGNYAWFPIHLILLLETIFTVLPWGIQSKLARHPFFRAFLGTRLLATK